MMFEMLGATIVGVLIFGFWIVVGAVILITANRINRIYNNVRRIREILEETHQGSSA